MKSIVRIFLFSICVISCSQKPSVLTEKSIIGNWECISGCDAEFYLFTESKRGFDFVSYKNQKIFKTGIFYISDSLLTFKTDDSVSTIYMAELRNDSLILEKGKIILKFYIEETDFSNHTDELFVGMENLLNVFPDLDFGNQEPVDFSYKIKTFEDQYETITIAGLGVKSIIKLGGDFINADDVTSRISNVIIEQGFKPDELNNSDNCSAFISENMVVLICAMETQPNELNMNISFGFIN